MQLGKDFKKVLKQIEEEKGLSEETIVSSLEAAMVSAYKKFKGGNQHIEVHIDIESGEISLYEVYEIVSEVVSRKRSNFTIKIKSQKRFFRSSVFSRTDTFSFFALSI